MADMKNEANARIIYRNVASTSPSCFEAHAGLFRLLMKGILDALAKSLILN